MKPLEEKPQKPIKKYKVKSPSQRILEDFLKAGVPYAEVTVKGEGVNAGYIAREIGRVIKTLKKENVKVWAKDKTTIVLIKE